MSKTEAQPSVSDSQPEELPKIRIGISTISDVVFGLALEIGSVILVAKLPQNGRDLSFDILDFGFSFLIIVMVWLSYRRTINLLPYETQGTVLVNLALLFCVSLEPFLFYVLVVSSGPVVTPASTAFALDVGAMMLLLAGLGFLLMKEERNARQAKVHPAHIEKLSGASFGRIVVACMFLASALPAFEVASPLGSTIQDNVWYAGLVCTFILHYVGSVPRKGTKPVEG